MASINNNSQPQFTLKDVTVHKKERVFQGFFAIDHYDISYKMYSGKTTPILKREIFERDHDAVAILPYDKKTDEIVLIEQFRPGALKDPVSPWLIEIVAGMIDDGETEEEACIRELQEEAKITITKENLHLVNRVYPSPGGASERVSIFIADVDSSHLSSFGGLEIEHEDIRIFKVKAQEAFDLVKSMRICNCASLVALNYLQLNKDEFMH